MTLVFVIVGLAVIAAAAWFVVGRFDAQLPDAGGDLRPDERGGDPSFDVVLRGYRMDEVDATIAELKSEIEALKNQKPRR